MTALLRTVAALLSRRTPITPRWCHRCQTTVTSINREQRRAALVDGWVTCECGADLAVGII